MRLRRFLTLAFMLSLVLSLSYRSASAQEQIRAFWADAFHNGFFTKAQTDKLIADVKASNCNAIIAQVRRRGDTYYPSPLEPFAANADTEFDALDYLIKQAHAQNPPIKVHAWLCTLPVWNSNKTVPASPYHPFNLYPEYLTKSNTGVTFDGSNYVIDPGNPDALQYIHDVYMDVVKRYDVDGIHYDYVRFASNAYGYNDVSVARFNKRFGRTGTPSKTDPDWLQWRRDQVSAMVRRIYADTMAIKPNVEVSGSTITWGNGPGTNDAAWTGTSAYSSVLQDWRAWMEEGILDINIPMTYYDWSSNSTYYTNWVEFMKNNKYNRQLAIGPGIYMNTIPNTYKEIKSALEPSTRGLYADGVTFYSYAVPNSGTVDATRFRAMLTTPTDDNEQNPPFATTVANPDMPWKSHPTKGIIRGTVLQAGGAPVDGALIALNGTERTTVTDGTGFYAFIDVDPGSYGITMKLQSTSAGDATATATVEPGKVATADMVLPSGTDVVGDDADEGVVVTGNWVATAAGTGYYGAGYRSIPTSTDGGGGNSATWHIALKSDGLYNVYARWPARWDNTWTANYVINHAGGQTTVVRSQASNGNQWVSLGSFNFKAGDATIMLTDKSVRTGTQLRVVADAIKLENFVEGLGKAWCRSTPSGVYSSPAAGDKRVFIGDNSGHLYAMNSDGGGYLWKFPNNSAGLGNPVYGRPAYDGTNVYFACGTKVYAVNAATGKSAWDDTATPTLATAQVNSSPVVTGKYIYVCSDDSRIYALDKATGAIARRSPVLPGQPISTPAVPSANAVWVGLDDGDIVALSEDLSTIRFTRSTGGAVAASPNVDMSNGRLYIGSMDGKFYCLNATTGSDLWSPVNIGNAIISSAWLDSKSNQIYFGTNASSGGNPSAKIYALNASSGTVTPGFPFEVPGAGNFASSPVVARGASGTPYIYIGNTNGTFYALNASDPTRYRFYTTDPSQMVGERLGAFLSSPAALPGENLVVIGCTSGKVYGMKLQ